MKKITLLLLSLSLVGCSTARVKQTNESIITYHRADGTIEKTEARKLDSDVSAIGDGTASVSKLSASQTKTGTLSLGTQGADTEALSPAMLMLAKTLHEAFKLAQELK